MFIRGNMFQEQGASPFHLWILFYPRYPAHLPLWAETCVASGLSHTASRRYAMGCLRENSSAKSRQRGKRRRVAQSQVFVQEAVASSMWRMDRHMPR